MEPRDGNKTTHLYQVLGLEVQSDTTKVVFPNPGVYMETKLSSSLNHVQTSCQVIETFLCPQLHPSFFQVE
jgi:hypothetical protein